MFRPATRLIARSTAVRAVPRASAPSPRFLSTAPPAQKSRSWKSLAARLGAVGAIIYYYNTTDVFAEEPRQAVHSLPEAHDETEQLPTIEALAQERQRRKAEIAEVAAAQQKEAAAAEKTSAAPGGGVEQLEEEADQQGAFNPETGEINWDCPCLGGMAHGPCGEEFKAAFSCFVYSTEEPKGMDCIDKFKDMQNCFRQYPEVYGSELEPDEEDDAPIEEGQSGPATAVGDTKHAPQPSSDSSRGKTEQDQTHSLVPQSYRPSEDSKTERAKAATEQVMKEDEPLSESDELIPKAAHDATQATQANEDEK